MTEPMIEARGLCKAYSRGGEVLHVLDHLDLEMEVGHFYALMGPSGSGKTTLLNLAGAMDFPTSGDVHINGTVTSGLADAELTAIRRKHVGFVFQFFQLLPTLSVLENVELPLLLAGQTDNRRQAIERLAWVEMADYAKRLPHQLSGGQRQRVAIARELFKRPDLLLLDEATSALDSELERGIHASIESLRGTATVIIVAHRLSTVKHCDRIFVLEAGRVAEQGSFSELLATKGSRFARMCAMQNTVH